MSTARARGTAAVVRRPSGAGRSSAQRLTARVPRVPGTAPGSPVLIVVRASGAHTRPCEHEDQYGAFEHAARPHDGPVTKRLESGISGRILPLRREPSTRPVVLKY